MGVFLRLTLLPCHCLSPLRSLKAGAAAVHTAAAMKAKTLADKVLQPCLQERPMLSSCCSTPIIRGDVLTTAECSVSETISGAAVATPLSSWKGQRLRQHRSSCKIPAVTEQHEEKVATPAREDIVNSSGMRKGIRRRLQMEGTTAKVAVTRVVSTVDLKVTETSIGVSETPLKAPTLARRKRQGGSVTVDVMTAGEEKAVAVADGGLQGAVVDAEEGWRSLGVVGGELSLSLTLPTGQSFRWRETANGEYTGVIGPRLVSLRQPGGGSGEVWYRFYAVETHSLLSNEGKSKTATNGKRRKGEVEERSAPPPCRGCEPEEEDLSALQDYFNLGTSLRDLCKGFAEADARFAALAPFLVGARMLRQDPLECLFQFICSSNNHISRISGMVDRLASYGRHLATVGGYSFHAFPTLDQLKHVTEEELRAAGFGYRAKFIVNTVQELLQKPGGGEAWLRSLRTVPLETAVSELCSLPGVGPKVAACIALFSLDKHQAIPVDTHVWQLAVEHYMPEVEGKSLTLKMHGLIQEFFVRRFGPYAGWAHNTLFIAELAALQPRLPAHLCSPPRKAARTQKGPKPKKKTAKEKGGIT